MKIRVKFVASVMTTMNTKKLGSDVIMKTVVDGTTIGVLALEGSPALKKSSFASSVDY